MLLDDLMKLYYTDKCSLDHGYNVFYEEFLEPIKNDNLSLLEIGIYRPPAGSIRQEGASLKTWYDYLPNTKIYGIDLDDFSNLNNDRIQTFICNHDKPEMLIDVMNKIGSELDIIIDDGSHFMNSHQIILSTLFRYLKPGGMFIIEDLHTCHMPEYLRGDESTLDILKNFKDTGLLKGKYITDEDSKYLSLNINNIKIKMGISSEIVFITKK
jgi:hypothetical protein